MLNSSECSKTVVYISCTVGSYHTHNGVYDLSSLGKNPRQFKVQMKSCIPVVLYIVDSYFSQNGGKFYQR